jgi:hypothetical protein
MFIGLVKDGTMRSTAAPAASVTAGAASYRPTVKQLLTSVVREICTLRGSGRSPLATRWAISDDRPYRDNNRGDRLFGHQYASAGNWREDF